LFEQKLVSICMSARIKNLHPLTQLFSFITPEMRNVSIDTELLTHFFMSLGVTITEEDTTTIHRYF
jgi:hypothetical protein